MPYHKNTGSYQPTLVPKIGVTYGKWTTKEYFGRGIYLCECACGKRLKISACSLEQGERTMCVRCRAGMPEGQAAANECYGNYRGNARRSKRDFELTRDQAFQFFESPCYYCGLPPYGNYKGFKFTGIDRIDNSVGYVLSNCLPCCSICNHMKHVLSYDDFLAHVSRIVEHRG